MADNPSRPDVQIVEADYKLKKKIGMHVDLNKVFSEEKKKAADAVVENSKDDLLSGLEEELAQITALLAAEQLDKEAFAELQRALLTIKSNAAMAGYPLASTVARSCFVYIEHKTVMSEDDLTVTQAHMDALRAIFHNEVTGDGGEVGTELLNSLSALTAKFSPYE